MGITLKLKQDLKKYNINLPTDGRKIKPILKEKKWLKEQYEVHLRELVKIAKKKEKELETRNIKKYQKEVENTITKEEVRRNVENRNRIYKNITVSKIQMNYIKNKLFYMMAKQSGFKSYFKYTLVNDRADLVGIQNITEDEVIYQQMNKRTYNPPVFPSQDLGLFIVFYQVRKFLRQNLTKKVWLSGNFGTMRHNEIFLSSVSSKSRIIRNNRDIDDVIQDFTTQYIKFSEQSYITPFNLNSIDIHIAKVNAISGSSYVELPDFIRNKKAIINIKNEDKKCFLYSVLCGLKIPENHPERVSHYVNRINDLLYKEDDMPMDINKIIFFEKRNDLRINLYGLEDRSIIPLYVSHNKDKVDFPLIHLFFYKNHYCYIKDFNKLMGSSGEKYLVCPYCCEFTSNGTGAKNAMDKHMSYCITGQKVEMPNDDEIKFKHYNHINECPVRIYADFETYNDKSMKHNSKNGKSSFNTGHKPASFKILVVSDIPVDGFERVDKYYSKSIIYKGVDCDVVFVKKIQELENDLTELIYKVQYDNKYNIKMSVEEKNEYYKCKSCWLCKETFDECNKKVRHHNHNTGVYHSALCNNCNIQIKDTVKIPVFFHNLNYDKNVFFKSLVHYDKIKDVSILPDNSEKFKSFTVGKLHFIDTMRFMLSSLASLIKNVPEDKMYFLKHLAKNDEELVLMKQKGHFPYEWFDDIEKFKMPITELQKEMFDNNLTLSKLQDEEWNDVLNIIQKLNINTFEEYHDFYLNIDVNGLADVFENFRTTSLQYYKLDPCHYVGTPSFGWDAMLLKTGVKLELLKDSEMYLFYERGIRGGQSVVFNKYVEANNKYMSNYDENKKSTYISYLDANNLYGWAMAKKLPYAGFKWLNEELSLDFIRNYNEDSDIGYTLEVDLHYPQHLHDKHNDYPLAPERLKLGNCEKLCGTFYDKKNYIVDIRNLKLYMSLGIEVQAIHRVIQYKQKEWLKDWIDLNTDYRKNTKNDFEKDYFKLMNNAVFGKTMENVRGRVDVKCAFDDDYLRKYTSKPNFKSLEVMKKDNKEMCIMEMKKNVVKLDKPIYAGFTILDLSKYLMYDFHYNTMKVKYGDKIELLMTDTDSLVYKVETEDFYKDMYEMKEYFDMSEYDKNNPIYDETNKKVIGRFKDETPLSTIKQFVGVRSKCYALETEDLKITKKLKGITKCIVKKTIDITDYKKCVLENIDMYRDVNSIRTKGLTNYSLQQTKLALSNQDDKRVWNGINSFAYGHYKIIN